MKSRIKKICCYRIIALVIGIFYASFVTTTGFGLPCLFNTITGLKCPGCGITHMCISILHGDFKSAMQYNFVLFWLTPLFVYLIGDYLFRYIKTGTFKLLKWQSILTYIIIGILVIFGIIRNIGGF